MKKYFSSFNSHFSFQKGFTLVELLASIIVLVALGSIITGIITSSLRGANKTTTVENIRQNGNYAISQMSKTIQYAQTFNGLSNEDDDEKYVLACPFFVEPSPEPVKPVKTDYKFIKVTSLDRIQTKYNCFNNTLTVGTAEGDPVSLVDDSVVVENCKLSCTQTKSTDVPVIGISFELKSRNPGNLVENNSSSVKFETSVVMRNYKK